MTARIIILALLSAVSAVHLYHSWIDDSAKRKYTKPFLLPLIIAYYLVSASEISVILVIALAASWLGDVLLIPKGNKWFTFGGISFMITHFLFIAVYAFQFDVSAAVRPLTITAAVAYYGISAVIIKKLTPSTPKMMLAPMYIYLLSNSTMNVFALMQLISLRTSGAAVAYAGAVLFFISDCTLFLVRYHKNKDLIFKKHFTVMLTYILGELLIVQGMLMITGGINV